MQCLNQLLCRRWQDSTGAPFFCKRSPLLGFLLPALYHTQCSVCQHPILMSTGDLEGLCPWCLLCRWSHCHIQVQPPKAASRHAVLWPVSHYLCNSPSTSTRNSGWIVLKSCLSFPLNSLHFSLFITPNNEKIFPVMYLWNMEAYFLSCILPNMCLPLPGIENPSLLFLNTETLCSCLSLP